MSRESGNPSPNPPPRFRVQDYLSPLRVLGFHRLMKSAPFWDRARLDAWAHDKRARIVRHAFETVPYYRERLLRAGVAMDRLHEHEQWQRIPLIDKSVVVSNLTQMCSSRRTSGAVWASTSGSTGMPMRILLDRNINAAAAALFWRAWNTGGYWHLGQRHATMKGPFDEGLLRVNWRIRALEIIAARINEGSVRTLQAALAKYRPRFLRGYPSAMYLFCTLLEEAGLRLHIPMVCSGSETLQDYQRAKIEAVLGARVINHYTHWERAASILECEQGAMHAQEDYGHHELLDKQGNPVPPGQLGEITVTGLHNYAMPLIRYRTGDVGIWSDRPCACGRSFPVIERILGRDADFLIRRDGVIVSGMSLTRFMRDLVAVRFVQLVQSEPGSIHVKVVRAPNYADSTTAAIIRVLAAMFDGQMDIDVQFCDVEKLERNPAGKIRQYVNRSSGIERLAAARGGGRG